MIASTSISSIRVNAPGDDATKRLPPCEGGVGGWKWPEASISRSEQRLVFVVIDRLPVGAMAQPPVDRAVDGLLEKPHRAVAEGEVGSLSRMSAARIRPRTSATRQVFLLNPRFQISGRQVFGQRRVRGLGQLEGREIDPVDRMAGVAQRGPRAREPAQRRGNGNLADEDRLGKAVDHIHHPHAAVQVEAAMIVHVDRRLDIVLARRVTAPGRSAWTGGAVHALAAVAVQASGWPSQQVRVAQADMRTMLLTGS